MGGMDKRLVYLDHYVNKELAPFLSLNHWIFHISEEQVDEGDWAEITIEDFDEATVKVGPKFWSASSHLKTVALIHELFHVPVTRVHENIELAVDALRVMLEGKDREIAEKQIAIHMMVAHRMEERLVNTLGVILAPHAPKWKPPRK